MNKKWIPPAALAVTMIASAYGVVQLQGQGQSQVPAADLTNATTAEVRDAQGQVVLQGQFAAPVEEDGNLERRATLAPGADADAAGEAEVEYAKQGAKEQEVEFQVKNLAPDTSYNFLVDGNVVATAKTDKKGEAEVELDVKMPGQ